MIADPSSPSVGGIPSRVASSSSSPLPESPIYLPLWLNIALAFAAGLDSTGRARRLRHHWLLDEAAS